MPTTLLRGRTGRQQPHVGEVQLLSVSCTPTYSGSPASATTTESSAGIPSSSTSPVRTPYCGSSPAVNLAIRTPGAYRRLGQVAVPTLVGVETLPEPSVTTLDESAWRARRASHEARVDAWVQPHLARRRAGVAHPVEDFLFTYYSQRPAALRRWHPGFGVGLVGAASYSDLKGYVEREGVLTVSREHVDSQGPLLTSLHALLTGTASRPAQLGCFGMHEWAMVYRQPPDDVRHRSWPLRLGSDGTDEVVESHRIACSHFDAFRFFSDDARPRNTLRPRHDDRPAFEQPGCLHAGMDLYKHAYRLTPMVGSELVADCFELARDIRVLDMRASPYDLSELGYEPIEIETVEGKQQYVTAQRVFAERGAPLRRRTLGDTGPSSRWLHLPGEQTRALVERPPAAAHLLAGLDSMVHVASAAAWSRLSWASCCSGCMPSCSFHNRSRQCGLRAKWWCPDIGVHLCDDRSTASRQRRRQLGI